MNKEYVVCITYMLVSRSGNSVSGELETYFESNTVGGCIGKLIRFASAEQPYGQTLKIMGWAIAQVVTGSEDDTDE